MSKLVTCYLLIALFLSSLPLPISAQQPTSQQSSLEEEEPAVRISTELIQFDVVVEDGKGRLVKDLKAEDFEIYEDKKLQEITNFSFIDLEPNKPTKSNEKPKPQTVDPKITPDAKTLQTGRKNQVGRTIALVIDELGIPLDAVQPIRDSLKRYVDNRVEPTDLVAIIRTGANIGVLQQFTSNKQQLYAAINEVKGNFTRLNRAGINSIEAVSPNSLDDVEDRNNAFSSSFLASLTELKFIVQGLKNLPGRKSMVVFSGVFPAFDSSGIGSSELSAINGNAVNPGSRTARIGAINSVNNSPITDAINSLIETANRSSVVCYTVDARGLQPTLSLSAADDFSPSSTIGTNGSNDVERQVQRTLERRSNLQIESQQGMRFLAGATGGIFSIGNDTGIKTTLDDQQGYYLIGYSPQEATFNVKNPYHKLSIKVKRPGLTVRTRVGFYGVEDKEFKALTPQEELVNAAISPFSATDVYVQLTPLFTYSKKDGNLLRSLIHINCKDLTFVDDVEGNKKAKIEMLVYTFGKNGNLINRVSQMSDVKIKAEKFQDLLERGFAIILNTPAKLSGTYQVRAVVRDATTKKLGSAGQLVTVPEIKNNKLALSGLTLAEERLKKEKQENFSEVELITLATRKFKSGSLLQYNYHIYNPKLDSGDKKPKLKLQTILYKEGQKVFSNDSMFDPKGQQNFLDLQAGGKFVLGTELVPGKYTFQVVVTDLVNKNATQSQELDFEILAK